MSNYLIQELASSQKSWFNSADKNYLIYHLHLICAYFYRNTRDLDHWAKELRGFYSSLPKLKSTKRIPERHKFEAVLELSYSDYESYLPAWVKKINKDKLALVDVKVTNKDKIALYRFIETVKEQHINKLYANESHEISRDEIIEIVKAALQKYPLQ